MESDPYKIIIGKWGSRTIVTVVPRKVDKPTEAFRNPADAMAYADRLKALYRWPIEDHREPRDDART